MVLEEAPNGMTANGVDIFAVVIEPSANAAAAAPCPANEYTAVVFTSIMRILLLALSLTNNRFLLLS